MNDCIPYCALILGRAESGESGYSSSSLGFFFPGLLEDLALPSVNGVLLK